MDPDLASSVVQEEMPFKDISYLVLAALSFSGAEPFAQFW